jgi:hypothetical protein
MRSDAETDSDEPLEVVPIPIFRRLMPETLATESGDPSGEHTSVATHGPTNTFGNGVYEGQCGVTVSIAFWT